MNLIKAQNLYNDICSHINLLMAKDNKTNYFLNMEAAFLSFWRGDLDEALNIYQQIEKDYGDHYMLQFRIGEIYNIKGEIAKALVAFDICENLTQKPQLNYLNLYRIKIKLAYIYWRLGRDFIDFAINKINAAENIYEKHGYSFPQGYDYYGNIFNSSCYYHLEKYLISKESEDYEGALQKLQKLEKYINKNFRRATANMLDTISWFYYNIYLKEKESNKMTASKYLEDAKKLCKLIDEKDNTSTFKRYSEKIQENHIKRIFKPH